MNETSLVIADDLGERWLASLENGRVSELAIIPFDDQRWLGTIAKGRVTKLVSGVAAAFVDVGLARDVFMIRPDTGPAVDERRLRAGDEVLVQIIREADRQGHTVRRSGRSGKGHRATSAITLPGWMLVLVPHNPQRGVSRRIFDPEERMRLKELIDQLEPESYGFIARTAASGASFEDLCVEAEALVERWREIEQHADGLKAPAIVHQEEDPALAFTRDHLAQDPQRIVVQGQADWQPLAAAIGDQPGQDASIVVEHEGPLPAVEAFGLDLALEEVMRSDVDLPGGGHLVFQITEAMITVDVNSGRDTQARALEDTALRTNVAAAREIVRQLRLRDLGGLIAIDFIDMQQEENRDEVFRVLDEELRRDRAKTRTAPLTEFCLGQITRQRRRPPLERILRQPCDTCGHAFVTRPQTRARTLLRELRRVARPHPDARFLVEGPAKVVLAAREIAEEWGASSQLPPTTSIDWRQGAFGVSIKGNDA